jgi:hypothetical protein
MTTPSYYVTIDSEFRDDQKYPFPTDFSVKFKDTTTGTQVIGVPTGPNIQDSFFTPLQIDPDYYSSNFRVTNGQVYNLKKLEDNTFLMCGVIQPLTGASQFSIYNDTTTFVSLTGLGYYNSFLSNISFTNGAYQFNWIVYSQATGTNEVNRSSFDLDDNDNIYFLFDYTSSFNFNIVQTPALTPSTLYAVPNPTTPLTNNCLATFALTLNGNIYYTNGHAWGYHLISSNQDIKATAINGRNNVNVDNALNLYVSGNTNPYNPNLFYYNVATQYTGATQSAGAYGNGMTLYTYNGTTYLGGYRNGSPWREGFWFDIYTISSTGVSLISTDFASQRAVPGAEYNSVVVPANSEWFWVYGNTGYFASYMDTFDVRLVLNGVNLITGDATFNVNNSIYYDDGSFTQFSCITSATVSNYIYAFSPTDYSWSYIRLFRINLNSISTWTVVSQSPQGLSRIANSFYFENPIFNFREGNTFYISGIDNNLWANILTITIDPVTFAVTYGNVCRVRITTQSLASGGWYSMMFKMNNRLYLFACDTSAQGNALIDVTDFNNPIITSNALSGCKPFVTYYTSNGGHYLVDNSSYIYIINNPYNPVLASNFFPQIEDISNPSTKVLYNDLLIGQITNPSLKLYTVNFISVPVTINSIHYNLNIDQTFNTTTTANIDAITLEDAPYMAELRGNRLYVTNISNINSVQAINNFNVFSETSPNIGSNTDPNNFRTLLTFNFYNCITLTHIVSGEYVYFCIVFYTPAPSLPITNNFPTGDFYLLVVQTNKAFDFIQSRYIYLGTSVWTIYQTYVTGVVPYAQNGNIYCVIQYYNYPRNLLIYEFLPSSDSFLLKSTLTNVSVTYDPETGNGAPFSYPESQYRSWYQWGCIPYTYDDGPLYGQTWLFVTITRNQDFYAGSIGCYIIPINVTNPSNPIGYYNSTPGSQNGPLNTYNSAFSNQMAIIKYSSNDIRLIMHGSYNGNFAVNMTNPTGMSYFGIIGLFNPPVNTFPRGGGQPGIYPRFWGDWTNPLALVNNSSTSQYYTVQANQVESPGSLNPTQNLGNYRYLSYVNVTDINNTYLNQLIPINPSGAKCQTLLPVYYQQKTYVAMLNTTITYVSYANYYFYTTNYRLIDVTNPSFAMSYPPVQGAYPSAVTTSYTGLNGIGLSFIHKMTNEGGPLWINYLGSDGTGIQGVNTNISNISLDSTLTFAYVSGGWQNKIEAYNPNKSKVNLITSNYSSYNGFIAKINLSNDGTFSWLIPLYGTDDVYVQRLNYISSKNLIGIVGYYNTPIMQVFAIQTSSAGPFTNPISSQLNLPNTSISAGFLITVNTSGTVSYYSTLYTDVSLRDVQIFDLVVDEASTNKSIKIVGISNANLLQCIDSSLTNVQNTYSELDPITQHYLIVYSYDLNGLYQYSDRVEFPPGMSVNVQDIKSFSANNRVVLFPNILTTVTSGDSINIYNKDGSLATTITNYVNNIYNCIIVQYQYDPTYVDVNGVSYSKIVLQDTFNYASESLVNYHLFIQGDLFDSYTGTTTQIADTTTLNKNFSIRHNFIENSKDTIILNQVIAIKNIVRKNFSYQNIDWAGSISPSELPGIISYNNTIAPSNPIIITALYGLTSINTSATGYYLMYATGTELNYVTINSITYSSGAYQMNITNPSQALNQDLPPGVYYGPYIYFTQTNQNSYYTLQFSPGTIYDKVYYNIKLNSLLIPNRRITSSFLPGTRSINDFRYIYLELYNEDDNGNIDTSVVNNYFTNNQNFVAINQRTKTLFEIPIAGVSVNSDTNFVVLSTTSNIPILVISPGYYNLHMRLVDMYGNLINFDSTPNSAKTSDSIFSGSTVNTSLMQIAASLTFTKITK